MNSIRVRDAILDDSKEVWAWRNDPDTRANSVQTAPVAWEAHQTWFASTLSDRNRRLFIGTVDGDKKIGVSRFDLAENGSSAVVSINLNPEMRGQRLSVPFLGASIEAFRSAGFRRLRIDAVVKTENIASVKCFEANGFKIVKTEGDLHHYSLPSPKGNS